MTIVYFSGRKIRGLSSDTKPTAPEADSKFYETNTKKTFDWNGSAWVERTTPEASAITANTAKISLDDNSVTLAKLAHGTAGKSIGYNSSTGVPEEQDAPEGGTSPFGNGADSDLSTLPSTLGTGTNSSSVTTLTGGTMTKTGYFKELIINAGDTVTVQKQSNERPTVIFAKTSITINGTLTATAKGANGGGSTSGGSGGSGGTSNAAGSNGATGSAGTVGTAGHFFNGEGTTGDGTAGTNSGSVSGYSACGGNNSGALTSGNGGSGTTTNVSGASKITTEEFDDILNVHTALNNKTYLYGSGGASGAAGSGGGGLGGGVLQSPSQGCREFRGHSGGTGGSGGAGGKGGGMIVLIAPTIIFGASGKIECNGEDGATGGTGGSGGNSLVKLQSSHNTQPLTNNNDSGDGGDGVGGSGGNGGFVMMFYKTITNLGSASNRTDSLGIQNDYTVYANVEVDKGAAGGSGGIAGKADGRVILHQL